MDARTKKTDRQAECNMSLSRHKSIDCKARIVHCMGTQVIRESPPQFENRIMTRVYVWSITRSTMYQKAPFC